MADDVQLNINDLLAAFSQESASLLQRAIIAEQKYKAAVVERDLARQEIASLSAAPDPGEQAGATKRVTRRGSVQ